MRSDHIGELVLRRPERRNALNAAAWARLPQVLKSARKTRGLRILIVRGAGDHFASGADISEFGMLYATPESAARISDDIAAALEALAAFPVPTLAMIRGTCIGGGCALALCCDLRFADNTAQFAITPVKLGLVYPFADVQRLTEIVGIAQAREILLSGRPVSARHAARIGLINRRFKPETLENKVLDYANTVASVSTRSTQITKQMFVRYQNGQRGDDNITRKMFLDGFSGKDFTEGYRAFLEKRKPDFD